jgi:hypothetical protein
MMPGTFILKAIDFEAEAQDGAILRLHIPELRATIRPAVEGPAGASLGRD